MRNKHWRLALALCACLALGGCRFAAEEKTVQEDRYVGVCVWLENLGEPVVGEDGMTYYETEPQEERPVELTDRQMQALLRGEAIDMGKRKYPLSGRTFYVYQWTDEFDGESTGFEQENWPGTLKNHVTVNDEGETYECDAVVYVTGSDFRYTETSDDLVLLHMDDVYVKPDGALYASRDGGSISGSIDGFSREITSSTSVTDEQGIKSAFSTRVKVTVQYVDELQSAAISAFREDGSLLTKTELDWRRADGELPYSIPEGAAYLILEETGVDIYGETAVNRTLANLPLDENTYAFTLRVPCGDGFAEPLPVIAKK